MALCKHNTSSDRGKLVALKVFHNRQDTQDTKVRPTGANFARVAFAAYEMILGLFSDAERMQSRLSLSQLGGRLQNATDCEVMR